MRYADDCNIYVRSDRAGHGDEEPKRLPHPPTPTQGQRHQECVGEALDAEVPRFSLSEGPNPKRIIAKQTLKRFRRRSSS